MSYQRRPSFPPVKKLAGVKEGLYNPNLPTLRRMDRDDAMHKLPNEHCRTTTPCSRENFASANSSLFDTAGEDMHCKVVLSEETKEAVKNGKSFSIQDCHVTQVQQKINNTNNNNNKNNSKDSGVNITKAWMIGAAGSPIVGYAIRRKHPDITSSWKYYIPQQTVGGVMTIPGKIRTTTVMKPMPATMFSRYRSPVYPNYRPYCHNPWK